MKSRSFTLARRHVCSGAGRAHFCKLSRSRGERRLVRILLSQGADDVPPIVRPEHASGAAAWDIS
jgi:hypothetical protein